MTTSSRCALVLVAAIFCALATQPAHARAQDTHSANGWNGPRETGASPESELAAIDAVSHTATSFYVASPLLLLATAGLLAGAAAAPPPTGCGPVCLSLSPLAAALLVGSLVTLLGSLVSLLIGIALDIDSGSRRGAWQARQRSRVSWRLDGGPGDLGIGLRGQF